MRAQIATFVAVGVALTGLAGGCSTREFRRAYDEARGRPAQDERLELNSATRGQLTTLPGLTDDDADRIIANRPYKSEGGLVRRSVLSEAKYDQIKRHIYIYSDRRD